MAAEMDEVKELLKSHPNLCIKEREDGKCQVVCKLTSHEMPCTLKAVQMYINGKKYKYECEHKLTSKEKELCSQYLIEKRRGQLYCTLTKKYINNLPHHIRQHLNGRRFHKAVVNSKMSTNSSHEQVEQKEEAESDKDIEMWVPSDSESESAEIEGLGSEFQDDKQTKCNEDDSYSFDILDTQDKIVENDIQTLQSSKAEKIKRKTKLKRSAKHLDKSRKKDRKLQKNGTEMPKKKKKTS